jgi:hypothetical protein
VKLWSTVWRVGLAGCAALALVGCSPDEVVIGERCPHPTSGRATIAGGKPADNGLYGTSCAPCGEHPPEFDDRGCPVYVTMESCGGSICVGNVQFDVAEDDAGAMVGGDAGGAGDAGDAALPEEDAGAN